MARVARLPTIERAPSGKARVPVQRLRTRFYAFLSYSHKDRELADWLHRELERFRVPHALAGKLTPNGVIPRRLTPIFRDQHDLSAGGELAEEIKAALAASQFLIVLCSPTAAKSRWTNQEIESFKRTRPEGCVLAAVVAGEPFASEIRGREDEECFPPALRYKYDRRGHQTNKRAEPLAADFRPSGEGHRLALLKLVAGMLGVGLDELVQREQTRRQKRLAYVAAASIAGMAVTSALAVTALEARNEAREQRHNAEGLVAFMLGNLRDKLEPIGKLDALDGVGSKVLDYYSKQDTAQLSDAELLQRSRALSLMAQVADARGDVDGSLKLYREAMRGTAEAARRSPSDPQPIFEHAQNVFYVGQLAEQRGDLRTGEEAMRQYKKLSSQLVALGPDSMKWRMETQEADINLGVVLYQQRRFTEALAQFTEALQTIQAIATADPRNRDYQISVAESLAWLGDAQWAVGKYAAATATRQRQVAFLSSLVRGSGGDVELDQRLSTAYRLLAALYADEGQTENATAALRKAVSIADDLISREPKNALWVEYGVKAKLDLAKELLQAGQTAEAAAHTRDACQMVGRLMTRKAPKREWRLGLAHCWYTQARVSLAAGTKPKALEESERALAAARSVNTGDAVQDAFEMARAYRLIGDVRRELGDAEAARAAWARAFAALPRPGTDRPDELAERTLVLERAGRLEEAHESSARLAAMGYRDPELRNI